MNLCGLVRIAVSENRSHRDLRFSGMKCCSDGLSYRATGAMDEPSTPFAETRVRTGENHPHETRPESTRRPDPKQTACAASRSGSIRRPFCRGTCSRLGQAPAYADRPACAETLLDCYSRPRKRQSRDDSRMIYALLRRFKPVANRT